MKITDIKIRKTKEDTKLKAFIDVTLDNLLIIHGIKLVKSDKGFIVCMPSIKKDEKYLDIVHPANAEFRKYLTDEIVTKYQELVNKK
ncbi:SpoVG family protein [uncultured Fusobacterium sp.]|uniref:SpoVG family protein n=1 Tax=uncultured Fusobacterium sp. TaxID=159267 RepID=UPI0025F78F6C|nr:SpoVG family protein [uncultured Fusobacterium sp.]